MSVNFLCDEANSLGRMDQISDVLAIGRGYGIKLQLYYQDLGQLRKCWPDGADQTLLANTTQVFFGVNDQATAEYVSNRLGEQTIVVASGGHTTGETHTTQNPQHGQSGGGSSSYNANTTHNWSQIGRKLLKPEEVTALSPRTAISLVPGAPPIATTLVRYDEPSFRMPRRRGLFMAAVETACLFVVTAAFAAGVTVKVFPHILEVVDVRSITGVFQREGELWPGDNGR